MALLGTGLCALAAYRLTGTPLLGVALAVALANLAGLCCALGWTLRRGATPKALTALQHVTTALGGFFLFVSFALP